MPNAHAHPSHTQRLHRLAQAFVLLVLLLLAGPAFSVDGVIEINQAKALAGDVTPGDTAGFPVRISEPGSYVLTGNLTVSDVNTIGIEVVAEGVSLDLNGFQILGPTVCTSTDGQGSTVSCSPTGSGIGVRIVSALVRIRNGFVSGFGEAGISHFGTYDEAEIEDLVVTSNGGNGIALSGGKSSVVDTVSSTNAGRGIRIQKSGVIRGCQASENLEHGLEGVNGPVMIRDSVATSNGGFGLSGGNILYAGNVVEGNSSGTVNNGLQIGTNACDGNTTCP